jgi:hypothetical protein
VLDEFDCKRSEELYWARYGSLEEQVWREQIRDKRERRSEMKIAVRLFDYALDAVFPKWYWRQHYHHPDFPPMRLMYRDGTASNLVTRHPLPRLVSGK